EMDKISGICASAPSPIDPLDGKMLAPPNLDGVNNISMQHLLRERYNLPTVSEKDANAFALAEQWFGHVEANKDILYIFNDEGLGGGLIIHSRIHRGLGNGAGGIRHMAIDRDGRKRSGRSVGWLEALVSGIA